MKNTLCGIVLATLAGLCAAATDAARPHLSIVTEISPPSSMLENAQLVGFTTEKIRAIMQRVGIDYDISILPWKRAYLQAQSQGDTCVFSTTRTPERETLFKWVGPTHESDWTLFGLAGHDYHVTTLEDARQYRIGAYFGDVRADALMAQGFRVDSVQERLSNPRKLLLKRIDLWASSVRMGGAIVADNGWSGKIVPVLTFNRTALYLACNPEVPDALIARMNAALRAMNSAGVSSAIERKYNFASPDTRRAR